MRNCPPGKIGAHASHRGIKSHQQLAALDPGTIFHIDFGNDPAGRMGNALDFTFHRQRAATDHRPANRDKDRSHHKNGHEDADDLQRATRAQRQPLVDRLYRIIIDGQRRAAADFRLAGFDIHRVRAHSTPDSGFWVLTA